jgi:ATP-dependent Lon protease
VQLRLLASDDCGYIADSIAQNSGFDYRDKAKLLCQLNPVRRLENAVKLLKQEMEMLRLESDIQERTRAIIDQEQKDYYLREQMKAIREELGEGDEESEFSEYIRKIHGLNLDETSEKKLLKDVERLKKQPFGSSEAAVLRNYLDTLLELPWNVKTKERIDVSTARKVLEKDHFGLEKVKQRILETIAVRQMAPEMPPQIICLVGPPGVGKTSIAMSVAQALNRKLARISLGGVSDEAEIRGHRKTYVGAMPGRIIAAINQAGSCNPLLLLDEIDKLGHDHRGDPSSALLEVLDSEQNATFRDHFVELPFDLSDVLFITTANTTSTIPKPLLDRMEVIELSSYTDEEKLQIAKRYLLPKEMKRHGIDGRRFRIIGRKDNVINSGGIKIHAEEVEQMLRPHLSMPFIITKATDPKFGEVVALVYEEDSCGESIQSICQSVLPKYWQPRRYLPVAHILTTETGKPRRDISLYI